MALRQGIVVATHPEDHSVDLVMTDNGARLVGIQVMTPSGSTRTGTVDLPDVPPRKNKWDISEETDQEMIACVDMLGGIPIVVGFLYPQINQLLSKNPKLRNSRHQSDVTWSIDGNGDIQLDHPSGAYIRMGESADHVDTTGKNADGNSKIDRNTGRKVNLRIGLAGNAIEVTLTPDGDMKIKLDRDYDLAADGDIRLAAKGLFDIEAEGDLNLKTKGNATLSADGNITADAKGNVDVKAAGTATVQGTTATITAPGGTTINSAVVRVNGVVSATDFLKG